MTLHPVSTTLEADLRAAVRKHGVVVWLDNDGAYTAFVDRLVQQRAEQPDQVPFALLPYRGSHLTLMMQAEGVAAGADRAAVVVHLPRFTEDRVKASPVLELYSAGVRYRKGLDTLVSEAAAQRVQPDVIKSFLAEPGLTLDRADAWLSALMDDRAGGLAAQLQAMSLPALVDDLLADPNTSFLVRRLGSPTDLAVLWEHLGARTGLTAAWREQALSSRATHAEDVAFAVSSWALAVEYVSDLARKPVAPALQSVLGLPGSVVTACCALAAHLRERHPRPYTRWADETVLWLPEEQKAAAARDLGKIDTLRFEEDVVLRGALQAMSAMATEPKDWTEVLAWAEPRVAGRSFWVRQDDGRLAAWQLIEAAARVGRALAAAGPRLAARGGLSGAVERYLSHGAAVDQAHRHLEQVRTLRLTTSMPERDQVRSRVNEVRDAWRTWADDWARDFNALCKQDGFLPTAGLQQRNIFDEVVRPMTAEAGVTAYFMVDALRFEMAQELYAELANTPASSVQLKARLAELPTVTEVGMNVLAPVAVNGRLRPTLADGKVEGFSTGEFRVSGPSSRQRAMGDRVGGATCPMWTLDDVLHRETSNLKLAIARANLVIIHSQEIDQAGENGMGPSAFDGILRKLRHAWQLLREAGVKRFVITADHGFLLLDDTAQESAQAHGRKIDPKRRHAFSSIAADYDGEVRVPLADLGYDGASGHVMFPQSTAVFDTGKRGMSFVHGGNSLQERVIPVLTLVHRTSAGADSQRYGVVATPRDGVAGMHCVEAKVGPVSGDGLLFGGLTEIDIGLRVPDAPDVLVEVCDVRGSAKRLTGAVRARVGETFEIFFRLTGPVEARVRVELHHPGAEAEVVPYALDTRFLVSEVARRQPTPEPGVEPVAAPRESDAWLALLPPDGPRQMFAHIAAHGAVTDAEAQGMFPSPRAVRAFALAFESYAAKAPFGVRIETVGGVKRYVREENRG